MSYEKEKEIAIEAVQRAAKLCQQVRQDIPQAMTKDDKSPVTVADYGSQAVICQALGEAFPHDSIVGEEDAAQLRQPSLCDTLSKITKYVSSVFTNTTPEKVTQWIDLGNGKVGQRYWTLDPIDGTKGFLRQDQYAIALALIEEGEVKLGILGCPALTLPIVAKETGLIFVAVRGEGTTTHPLNPHPPLPPPRRGIGRGKGWVPHPIKVVSSNDGPNFCFVESVEASHGDQSRQKAVAEAIGITADSVRVDSQAKYGIVAAGQAALYLRLPSPKAPNYRENIWDHAAGSIVVEEAGGRVTDMYGKPLDFATGTKMVDNRGIVVSNGLIHDTVLAALQD